MATDGEAARPRDAEIPLANVRSAPRPAHARPLPTRQTVRKGRLKFLYFVFCLPANAQNGLSYNDGPVTAVTYPKIEYGHFDDNVDWLNSTWKPAMEAKKKAGLIADYKVFTARPKKPDEPNVIFMLTYPNMAGLDRRAKEEAVHAKMVGNAEVQNKARIGRSDFRKVLGSELIREIILK